MHVENLPRFGDDEIGASDEPEARFPAQTRFKSPGCSSEYYVTERAGPLFFASGDLQRLRSTRGVR